MLTAMLQESRILSLLAAAVTTRYDAFFSV